MDSLGDQSIPVDKKNWLKDITTSQEEKKQKFDIAYRCREEVLTKHFGEPLLPEYVLNIKRQLEEKADKINRSGEETVRHALILKEEGSRANEFFTIHATTYQENNETDRSEVRVNRYHVNEAKEKDSSDSDFSVHKYPYTVSVEVGSIWLGKTGKNDLPRVNVDDPPCSCSIQEQRAAVEGLPEPKSIHTRILDDMDSEFIGLCASQGVTIEDLESLQKTKFADPNDPDVEIYGLVVSYPFKLTERTLRNNHEDIYALSIIEKALKGGVSVENGEYGNYLFEILENTRRDFIDFNHSHSESSPTESEILSTMVYALADIDQVIPDIGQGKMDRFVYDYMNSNSSSPEGISEQNKDLLKKLSPIILPHCFRMDYGSGTTTKTQPEYRIDFSFLKDKRIVEQINSILSSS